MLLFLQVFLKCPRIFSFVLLYGTLNKILQTRINPLNNVSQKTVCISAHCLGTVQWWSPCIACLRPCVPSQHCVKKKKNWIEKIRWLSIQGLSSFCDLSLSNILIHTYKYRIMNWMGKIHFLPFGVKNFESHCSRMCYSEIR